MTDTTKILYNQKMRHLILPFEGGDVLLGSREEVQDFGEYLLKAWDVKIDRVDPRERAHAWAKRALDLEVEMNDVTAQLLDVYDRFIEAKATMVDLLDELLDEVHAE